MLAQYLKRYKYCMKQQCFITIQQKVTKSQLQLTLDQLRSYIESALDNIENNEPWNISNIYIIMKSLT